MLEMSDELVISLAMSPEKFPVNLNQAWKWIGYASKQCAKNRLLSSFKQGVDYVLFKKVVNRKVGATTTEVILLSFKCFKHLALAKGTSLGLELGRRLEFGEVLVSTQVASSPRERVSPERIAHYEKLLPSRQLLQPNTKVAGKSEVPLCQELSEPLTNIKMAICLLDQPLLPAQRQQYLTILRGECDRAIALTELVSKLHELATSTSRETVREFGAPSTCHPGTRTQAKRSAIKARLFKTSRSYSVLQLVTPRQQHGN
jgi:hypothetical protein